MDLEKLINIVAGEVIDKLKKKVKLYGGMAVGSVAGVILVFCSIFGGGALDEAEAVTYYNSSVATSGTQWENFKRFVLANESGTKTSDGKYYIVEDDGLGNPTVGHGLCLYSKADKTYPNKEAFNNNNINSEELAKKWLNGDSSGKVSVDICDKIWEERLRSIYYSLVDAYSNLSLTIYQYYALTDVKYRRGNIDGFWEAYNEKWSENDNRYKEDTTVEEYSQDSLYSFFNNGFTNTSNRCVYKKTKTVETF
jgi:hypothetical protein